MTSTDTLPKSAWGPGPWQDEPDEARWVDEATGLRCAIIRSEVSGALCGYVEIDHPALCKPLRELEAMDFDVHGGLTWSGLRFEEEGETGWWIGFDCGHAWDVMPAIDALLRTHGHRKPSRLDQLVDARARPHTPPAISHPARSAVAQAQALTLTASPAQAARPASPGGQGGRTAYGRR